MSGIGSLGFDSTLRYFMQGWGQSIVIDIGGTLESYYIDSPVLDQEVSLQKICALEKSQAAKNLIISSCTPTTSALLLLYHYLLCVWFLPIYSGHQVRWTYQPGSHRRKVTHDFSSTFFLRCVP